MENFVYHAPTYFCFGRDAEREAGALVRKFDGTKVLIHYGGALYRCRI